MITYSCLDYDYLCSTSIIYSYLHIIFTYLITFFWLNLRLFNNNNKNIYNFL